MSTGGSNVTDNVRGALGILERHVKELGNSRDMVSVTLDEIVNIEARVIALLKQVRHAHNLHSPVNSIPDEILAFIFEMAAIVEQDKDSDVDSESDAGDSESDEDEDEQGDILDWKSKELGNIVTVCRRWRRVALDDAKLWTSVNVYWKGTDSIERTKALLARSKGVMLSLWARDPSPHDFMDPAVVAGLTEQILAHSHRIRNLVIPVSRKSATVDLIQHLHLPKVKVLTIYRGSGIRNPSLKNAFPYGLPELRELHLSFFTTWRPGLFANLTVLRLTSFDGQLCLVPLAAFLELLELSPRLVDIHSMNYGPKDDGSLLPHHLIPLLHLRRLEIWHTDSRSILSRIKVPPSAKMEVHNQIFFDLGRQPDNHEYGTFFRTVPGDLSAFGMEEIKSMSLFSIDEVELEIRTTTGLLKIYEYWDQSADIELDDSTKISSLFDSLREHDIFPTVKAFEVGFYYHVEADPQFDMITADEWRGVLDRFPSLQRLSVHEYVGQELLAALGGNFLPNLVRLKLVVQKMDPLEDGVRLLESCIAMIQARKLAGMPLQSLEIRLHPSFKDAPVGIAVDGMKARLLDLEGKDIESVVFQ